MDVRHIALSADGRRAALGALQQRVAVCDLRTGTELTVLDTILDFGGQRLALNHEGSIVVAAAWAREGIAGYDVEHGTLLWQRRDLKRAQYITCSPRSDVTYVGFESGPACVLDSRTGATLSSHRGVRRLIESPHDKIVLKDGARPHVSSADFRDNLFHIKRTTFAILSAAFSTRHIVISEVGGPVRCFALNGGHTAWTFEPRAGVHCLDLMYSANEDAFFGVLWPFESGGEKELVRFGEDGSSIQVAAIGEPAETAFAQKTAMLVTSDLRLIGAVDGTLQGSLSDLGRAVSQ
jgi:hypothetical protein